MQYLADLPVSDKNNFKNVECNFSKGFPLKQVYPRDDNQKYIFIKHDNEDPIMRQLVRQREKLDNPKNKGKKTIVDFLHRKREFSEISESNNDNNNNSNLQNMASSSSSSNRIIPNNGRSSISVKKEKVTQRRKKNKSENRK